MADELRPCPFCDGEATYHFDINAHIVNAGCPKCNIRTQYERADTIGVRTVTEAWNRRVADILTIESFELVATLIRQMSEESRTQLEQCERICAAYCQMAAELLDARQECSLQPSLIDFDGREMVRWECECGAHFGNYKFKSSDEQHRPNYCPNCGRRANS